MLKRDRRLIEKIGRYYLAYKGNVRLESLLAKDLEIVEVDKVTRYFVLATMTLSVIKEALDYFRQARRTRLTYREFTVEYDSEPLGVVDVPRTLGVMSRRVYAYYTYIKGYDAPEYAIMNYLLRRIYAIASRYFEMVKDVPEEVKYFSVKEKLEQKLQELKGVLNYFRGEYFRPLTDYDPSWLKGTYNLYVTLSELEGLSFGIKSKDWKTNEVSRKMIKLILWRLYEIYIFFLVVKYLEGEGFTIEERGNVYVARKGEKEFQLVLNSDLDVSQLEAVDKLDEIKSFRGRPDLSLVAKKSVLIECKYSSSISYLTASRFKIMAYAYEYDPLTVILTYPGLDAQRLTAGSSSSTLDVEEKATYMMDERAKREGFIDISFRNSKKLYIVVLDPSDDDDENVAKIARIFTSNDYLKNLL
ncbi:MAG: hypothetical protein MjAS7_1911 [Metallosphaera javensis (ex Sakai et al. 2022)]|nr:MAG: hypothetical protein MjAS7_1911 [Metallosphaera javensis (ex Sakai et al. 2022)]